MRKTLSACALLVLTSCGASRPVDTAHAAIYQAIAPEYSRYVTEDARLTAEQKNRRLETVSQWKRLVEASDDR